MLNYSIHPQHHHNEKASQRNYLKETAKGRKDVTNKYEEIIQEDKGIRQARLTFSTIWFTKSFCLIPTAMANKLSEGFAFFWHINIAMYVLKNIEKKKKSQEDQHISAKK